MFTGMMIAGNLMFIRMMFSGILMIAVMTFTGNVYCLIASRARQTSIRDTMTSLRELVEEFFRKVLVGLTGSDVLVDSSGSTPFVVDVELGSDGDD
jgi:hypothetical protein